MLRVHQVFPHRVVEVIPRYPGRSAFECALYERDPPPATTASLEVTDILDFVELQIVGVSCCRKC